MANLGPKGSRGPKGPPGEWRAMTIDVAVLGHHEPARYRRALFSALASHPTTITPIIDSAGGMEEELRAAIPPGCMEPHIIHAGNAGLAKNAALDAPIADGVSYRFLLDGDDMLYPCAMDSIEADIEASRERCSHTGGWLDIDLLGIVGFDVLPDKKWGDTWTPEWPRTGQEVGWDAYPYITPWMPRLWKLPAREILRHAADMPAYEDGLLCYQALGAFLRSQADEYMRDEADVVISRATDIYVVDRATPASIQKDRARMDLCADALRWRRMQHVRKDASSPGQLPILPDRRPLISVDMKEKLLQMWSEV